ncbi:ribonuclease P protein subunit p29 [Ooceraea biroi]|uniref:ribonuclease P protein subunit p29 n=1 Tax=Ooceraea biroi TaxID=2015173 RepID=UPI000F07EF7C|nr:ribonuclease P protein subunit p29 [Ooceraea biroi]
MSDYADLCSPLPNITSASDVPICQNREQGVVNFLQNMLPSSDCKQIPDELRKTFIFSKFKIKRKRKTDCRSTFLSTRRTKHGPSMSASDILSKKQLKYSEVYPLNQLWLDYMRDLLGVTSFAGIPKSPEDSNWESVNQQLMRADFHGANITIHKSRCASLVGLTGIIIQDTKRTFKICGTDDSIRTIPKDLVIICIHMGNGVTLKVYGKHLAVRPVERAVKKFRTVGLTRL